MDQHHFPAIFGVHQGIPWVLTLPIGANLTFWFIRTARRRTPRYIVSRIIISSSESVELSSSALSTSTERFHSPASVAVQDWSLSIRILFLAIAEALPLSLHRPTTTRASESHPPHIQISSKWLTQSTNYCIPGFPTSLMKSAMDRNRPRNGYSDVNWQFAMEQHHVQ